MMTIPEVIKEVADAVAMLCEMGIKPVDNPTDFKAYAGGWGSISNYCKVELGKISQVKDPVGDEVLAVYVHSITEKESGELLCDKYIEERRWIELDGLEGYLNKHGFRR